MQNEALNKVSEIGAALILTLLLFPAVIWKPFFNFTPVCIPLTFWDTPRQAAEYIFMKADNKWESLNSVCKM